MTRVIVFLVIEDVYYGPMIRSLLTVDIPTCICADAFLLARASLQIRLQPPAVVASRLLVFPRCKAKKERIEKRRNERKHHEEKEKGPVPIEQRGFEKKGKSEGAPLQIEWRKRPDGFIVEAIESTNTATTNRLSRENATRARFD